MDQTSVVSSMPPVALVGFAEAASAPEVVWSLVDAGFRVIAFARRGRKSAARYSRHIICHEITPPEQDLKGALTELATLIEEIDSQFSPSPKLLFPLDDTAVLICSRVAHPAGWVLAGPAGTIADLALNKLPQTQLAREAGFNVPETALARTAEEVRTFAGDRGFPIILKPAECIPIESGRIRSGRKWVCANREEMEVAIEQWSARMPLLVQRFVTGNGEGVFGLAAADGVRAWSAHRRLRMMNPQGSGASACVSQSVPDDLRTKVEALVGSAGWRGLFMIELLRDADGQLWFVELNGRPWGSIALSRRQGLEYPAWHLRLALDRHARVGLVPAGAPGIVCRHLGRELMHVLFVMRGPKSKALRGWPSVQRAFIDVIRVGRSDTFYNWRRQDLKVFFADCYFTLHDQIFKVSY